MKEWKEKKVVNFLFVWAVFAFVLFVRFYDSKTCEINTTMLAFSYQFGFISRGLIGSAYQFLDYVLPFDLMSYEWAMRFFQMSLILYFILLLLFFVICLKQCNNMSAVPLKYIVLFFTIFAVPMFSSEYNLGRLDMYCLMLSILGALCIIEGKMLWLVVIFSGFGVMAHQGNVFMYEGIMLVLLLYKMLSTEGRERRKYFLTFLLSFLLVSVLFLWFEFFSHMNGENVFERIVSMASALGPEGKWHEDVILHEIQGVDLSQKEKIWHIQNAVEFPVFIVLIFPYVILLVFFFRHLIQGAEQKKDRWKYFFVAIGSGTILPDLLLKVDFGRWMFVVVAYYAVVILSLLAMKDSSVESEVLRIAESAKQRPAISVMLFAYPILLQPLMHIHITGISWQIADMLNRTILHWWTE